MNNYKKSEVPEEELKNVAGGQDWNRDERDGGTLCPDCGQSQLKCVCRAACEKCGIDHPKKRLQNGVCVECRLTHLRP